MQAQLLNLLALVLDECVQRRYHQRELVGELELQQRGELTAQ
jgi:hypothetical protein